MLKNSVRNLFLVFVGLSLLSFSPIKEKVVQDFTLRNVDNKMVSTLDYSDAKGFIIVFTCNHCPFAKLYSKRFNALHKKYAMLKVPLIAINSMDSLIYKDEGFQYMQQKAQKDSFEFPYLQDADQIVGKNFGAKHTPTAYVIWKENNQWLIKYEGAIDDNGENADLAKPHISLAVDELLSGKNVTESKTASFGCAIFYRK